MTASAAVGSWCVSKSGGRVAISAAIARTIDNAERRIREAVDLKCTIYLEPDIDRDT